MITANAPATAWVAVAIALLALALGILNFYWANVRRKYALYLLPVHRVGFYTDPEFALVNAGHDDILITQVLCEFENAGRTGGAIPNQRLVINGGTDMLLPAGKLGHCVVEFNERFDGKFARDGAKEVLGNIVTYKRTMKIMVEWVDGDAILRRREVPMTEYGFSDAGGIVTGRPLLGPGARIDLYRAD